MSSGAHIHHHIAQTRRSIAPAALVLLAALSAASQTPRAPQSSHALETYAALPIAFEANAGQSDHRVKFLAHARSYTLFLTGDEAVLSLPSYAIHLKFLGAAQPSLTGRNQLPGKTNYFIGNDPKQWHTNVPTYSAVEYHSLYTGIDAVFHGDNHRLEFDFNIAPGADPRSIALEVEGARRMRLNRAGDVLLGIDATRDVVMGKPHIYQQSSTGRREIEGHYVLTARNRIAFALSAYDHAQPLVIDPTLAYSTYLGGSTEDLPYGIAADSSGSAYVVGQSFSANYPTTFGAYQTSCLATGETTCTPGTAFVTKLSPDGSSLVYSSFINDHSNEDGAYGVAVDSQGSAYVLGAERGEADFPTTAGAYQPTCNGGGSLGVQVFVAKLDPTGSTLEYSTCLMNSTPSAANQYSSGSTFVGGIAVDSYGDAYVTGETDFAESFPTTQGALETTCQVYPPQGCFVEQDPFVVKLNPTGTGVLYSTFLSGGTEASSVTTLGIAVDHLGNAYVIGNDGDAGQFPAGSAGGLITTPGSLLPTCPTYSCGGFIAEINGNGTALVYSTYLANVSDYVSPTAVAVDRYGEAYVSGFTSSNDFPSTVGVLQYYFTPPGASTANETDGFVIKMGALGLAYEYATLLGGTSYTTVATGIGIDTAGHAFVTGIADPGFPTTPGAFQTTTQAGANQAFLLELDPDGASLLYSTYLAGTTGETYDTQPSVTGVSYLAMDPLGDAYVIGQTSSPNFPTTSGAYQTHTPLPSGSQAATGFVAKFTVPQPIVLTISPTTIPSGTAGVAYSQTLTAAGGTGTVTFDVTTGSPPSGVMLTSDGELSGTPTQTGTFPFTVTATDSTNNTGTQAYSLQIGCPTITVGPSTIPTGTVGTPYGPVTFTETGGVGTTTFAISTNTLPGGITFTAGVLVGETASQTGSFPFIVTATDSNGCMGTVSDTLIINAAVTQPPAIVNDTETITVTDTEAFSDVADTETITVTDADTVRAYNDIAITPTPASFNASNGTAYQTYPYTAVQFTATGGIGTLTLTETGALPSGITFINGTLSGTPAASTAGGSYTFAVTATDADGDQTTVQGYILTVSTSTEPPANVSDTETITVSDTETFPDISDAEAITVTDTDTIAAYNAIAITPTPASFNASDGATYATDPYTPVQFTATGGTGTLNLTETGALPSGITFTNGTLSGTPAASTAGNSYTFSVTATDTNGDTTTLQGYTLTVTTRILPTLLLSANPDSLSIAQGQTGQTTLTFTPSGGYTGTLALGCVSLPDNSRCVFSQNGTPIDSLTLSGNNQPATILLTFVTDVPMLASLRQTPSASTTWQALILWWPACLLGLTAFSRNRKLRRRLTQRQFTLCLLVLSGIIAAGLTGCGLERPHYLTPVGTSKISVTATPSSGAAQTLTIDVTITK